MRALIVEEISEMPESRYPGSIEFRSYREEGPIVGIGFVCPCGCGTEGYLPLRGGGHPYEWDWDGNREAPTLTQLVHLQEGCGWNGWLRAGTWVQN